MDLLWLDGSPVLHVVDAHTYYQNAIMITDKSAALWRALCECWSTFCSGFPNVLRSDEEASFANNKFENLA